MRGTRWAVAKMARKIDSPYSSDEKPDSNPVTIFSIGSAPPPTCMSLPNSFAPASAPLTTSRFTAEAKMMMKIEERQK